MSQNVCQRWGQWCVIAVLAVVSGCGGAEGIPGLVKAEGTVTFNGQPLKEGSVSAIASDGKTIFSGSIVDGHYALSASPSAPGAKPGEYRVAIKGPASTMDESGKPVEASNPLPAKFSQTATSGLTLTVPSGGKSDINFDLKP